MRGNWLWRTLARAGGAYPGWSTPCSFLPVNTDRSFAEARFVSLSESETSNAPIHRSHPHGGHNRPEIAHECESFLAGRYYELLLRNHQQLLPGWALINPLAHASYTDLERLADLSPCRDDPLAFLSYLADEVLLRSGGDDVTLQRMQHETLVPLELVLLRQPGPVGRTELARIIQDRLEYRMSHSSSQWLQQGRCPR